MTILSSRMSTDAVITDVRPQQHGGEIRATSPFVSFEEVHVKLLVGNVIYFGLVICLFSSCFSRASQSEDCHPGMVSRSLHIQR